MSRPIPMFAHRQGTAPGDEGPGCEASHDAAANDRRSCAREGLFDLRFPPVPPSSSNAADPAGEAQETSLRARHYPIAIDETARAVWLAELLLAFDDVGFPRSPRAILWSWLEAFSVRMINRRTTLEGSKRYPYSTAAERPGPFMATRRRPVVYPR